MDGVQPSRKQIGPVQRVWEGSRLEKELLATAYQRVLPEKRIQLAESESSSRRKQSPSSPVLSDLGICQFNFVFAPIAIGGQS